MLQRNELLDLCRKWEAGCHDAIDQVYLLNVALASANKPRDYSSKKRHSVLREGFLPEITKLFGRASDVLFFQEHSVLYKLLTLFQKKSLEKSLENSLSSLC